MIPHERRRPRMPADRRMLAWVGVLAALHCHAGGPAFPWPQRDGHVAVEHADVKTVNPDYQRTRSQVLVREVARPSRAALDYAAYHASFMIADPAPESVPPLRQPDTSKPFRGLVERDTLTADIERTPLSGDERRHPLAFAPMLQFLEGKKLAGAEALEEIAGAVRDEGWGAPGHATMPAQQISEAYLHRPASGAVEMWVKIEFQPWFKPFRELPDQDADGFPEVYGRVRQDRVDRASVASLEREYMGRVLDRAEIKAWANQLSSYWYPSFNTDLIPAGPTFPDARTEENIKRELGGRVFSSPAIVLRGKPQGKPTYEVFLLPDSAPDSPGGRESRHADAHGVELPKTRATPDPRATAERVERELATQAEGSWTAWATELAAFQDVVRRRLRATPPKIKAFAGVDGFLFYRHSLEFAVGGDLERQRPGKNPLPVIVEFKKRLEASGVDFLFVPVPTKLDIFPDKLDPTLSGLVGHVVNPWARKLLLDLAQQGVEVVDLLPPFLAARAGGDGAGQEPLYQRQDTHWTDRGLRLAADIVAARIKKYPWYSGLARQAQTFGLADTTFTRFGDLHSRLPDAQKSRYKPETLAAHQVMRADGTPYEDDADSPIVVLGDSFTGVYELTDAEHAGISAHVARGIDYPVDLVMSYGGGPNVRQKLMRRGADALAGKKLVVWIMTARDLYDYWENWEPLSP